ncbi:MAG: type II secretion system F family protein [Candidatus Gracilibacteria bacterium]|nr:type II secretion system F family protein [Candidatus Gracilibacteria bacterium]
MSFFNKVKYIDRNGNFNGEKFLQLLDNARYALRTGKKPAGIIKKTTEGIIIGGISPKEIWQFINKLSNFLNSGIDIKTAFGILYKQVQNPRLKKIVNEIRLNLDHGLSITDTLRQYSKYFDTLIIALLDVGEKTGSLPKVLAELEKKLLESIELRAKIKGALIYPAILLLITITMVTFMMTFIIPKVTDSFVKSGVEIPALTQFLINISHFITGNYIAIIIGVIGFSVFFMIFKKTYLGQLCIGYINLRLPVFGFIVKQNNVILFINSFSLLLDSGVLLLEALEITSNVVPNIFYKKDIIRIKNEVETGIKLSNAMGLNVNNKEITFANPYFNEDFVHMINVGEETGTVGKTIDKIGQNYSAELKRYIANLMTMLEPFIIVFIGSIVGTIVIAIMLPFFNLAKVAKKM